MDETSDPQPEPADARDLLVERVIRAPRSVVWAAWTDAATLGRWWVPAPSVCRVLDLELWPGGSFRTDFSEDGEAFVPQITGCVLEVVPEQRLVWTTALVAGWRPAEDPFITTVIEMEDHPDGTRYRATALHSGIAQRDQHLELGFHAGWGIVTEQLAALVEEA
ncbi:SRPBCC family protein [Plantibacter sp. ME-Dv--P-095]|uniref:SRPBCC family protein n=1 Tax=Plantibacter sp. ME-Dv--P-095 TaxID=3040299 RepID=UPI00254EF5A4|nr:SRPBCC family protein [Plantibacter sp. ME-Dv--P-095]